MRATLEEEDEAWEAVWVARDPVVLLVALLLWSSFRSGVEKSKSFGYLSRKKMTGRRRGKNHPR